MRTISSNTQPIRSAAFSARRSPGLLSSLCLAFFAGAAAVQAQTWQTVDDAAGATGEKIHSITSDSAGNTFASGTMVDATGRAHAVIMKSSDSGATWSTVVDYPAVYTISVPGAPENSINATFNTIVSANVAGGESHLVAAGVYRRGLRPGTTSSYTPQWVIIRSKDAGATWETMDEFVHPTYSSVMTPRDVAVDANGNIYVVGMSAEYTGTPYYSPYVCHWLIRKGLATPGGMTWSTVGDLAYGDGGDSAHVYDADGPCGIACVGTNVFVVGGGTNSWVVRKSSNGGSTWQVVDNFRLDKKLKSHAYDVAADSAGNLYVCGFGNKLGSYWLVRRSTNGGSSWSTVDQFRFANATTPEAKAIAVDANNNVHVTGMASSTQMKWVTRQRSAATGAWSTTDLFSLAAGQDTVGRAITRDSAGNLFAAGSGTDAAGILHGWIVRRKLAN